MIQVHEGLADVWSVTATDDEPAEVHEACRVLTDQVRRKVRGIPRTATLEAWRETAVADAKRSAGVPTDKMRKALHAMANELLLDRQDRLDLAEMMLSREVDSWGSFTFEDASKLLDAMNGYVYVRYLRLRDREGVCDQCGKNL